MPKFLDYFTFVLLGLPGFSMSRGVDKIFGQRQRPFAYFLSPRFGTVGKHSSCKTNICPLKCMKITELANGR